MRNWKVKRICQRFQSLEFKIPTSSNYTHIYWTIVDIITTWEVTVFGGLVLIILAFGFFSSSSKHKGSKLFFLIEQYSLNWWFLMVLFSSVLKSSICEADFLLKMNTIAAYIMIGLISVCQFLSPWSLRVTASIYPKSSAIHFHHDKTIPSSLVGGK